MAVQQSKKLQTQDSVSGYNPYLIDDEDRHPLDIFFAPRAVAVIGASDRPGSVGRALLWNLISSPFGGTVYAVNPNRHNVLGILANRDIQSLPEPIDLAVILTPAHTVPGVIDDCIAAGVKGGVIISAGFRETGEPGRALEDEIRRKVIESGFRVIGPNSLGLMNPVIGLNAAFAGQIAQKGNVGFISQSGAMCAAILDKSFEVNVGFSAFVSLGSMVDVGWADLLYYLGNDRNTRSIVIYMQSMGDARSFLSAAREVALNKPIIILKPGQTEAAMALAANTPYYTAADACSDDVFSAALRRSGVLRVFDIASLFAMAQVLGKQPRPRGPRLSILSNAAAPNILATDDLLKTGGELAVLSEDTVRQLNDLLPGYWNHNNPIDILADADPARYARAVEIVLKDDNIDGLLITLTPQVMTDPTHTAVEITRVNDFRGKPVLASWMGGEEVAAGAAILNSHNIPTLSYPDSAARVFSAMWRYSYNLRGIYETPVLFPETAPEGAAHVDARRIIDAARGEGRDRLGETETKKILSAYGIPVAETGLARSAEETVAYAARTGYPVAMNLEWASGALAASLRHHFLYLSNDEELRRAFRMLEEYAANEGLPAEITVRPMVRVEGSRLVIGSRIDPQFGPVLYFGAGGPLGEAIRDRSLGLPPLNSTLARRMMEQTEVYTALKGARGYDPVDLAQLEQILVCFSLLVAEERRIKEIEISPMLAVSRQLIALDARAVLHPPDLSDDDLPRLVIRPYPAKYITRWVMKDGREVVIRPIRPEDEALMVEFHKTLSDDTVYYRYMGRRALDQRIKHERIAQICFIDYDRQMGLVAEYTNPESGESHFYAVGRLVRLHKGNDAEFALVVSDSVQGQGLGAEMLRRLVDVGRCEKIHRIVGTILPDNRPMLHLCRRIGFTVNKPIGGEVIAEIVP